METAAKVANKKDLGILRDFPGLVFITGRVFYRRRVNGAEGTFYLSVIKTAARDEYSHPGTVEVSSASPIGKPGEEWSGFCELSGYPRSFKTKPDYETGEVSQIHTADNRLRVVDVA